MVSKGRWRAGSSSLCVNGKGRAIEHGYHPEASPDFRCSLTRASHLSRRRLGEGGSEATLHRRRLPITSHFSPRLALRRAAQFLTRHRWFRIVRRLRAEMGLLPVIDQFRQTRIQFPHDTANIYVIEPLPLPAVLHGVLLVGSVPQFDGVRITFRRGFKLPEPHFFFQNLFRQLFRRWSLFSFC
jgi:hypothetical protein